MTTSEAGITNDAKKLKKIYKALVTREEKEAAKERGDFMYHPLPKVEKEIRKRVRERMRIEFPDYLRQRQALNEAEKKAMLPVKPKEQLKIRDVTNDYRNLIQPPRLPMKRRVI